MAFTMTAPEARELARSFRDLSVKLGNYRFDHWDRLSEAERKELEDSEWSLLNTSSNLITAACELTLDDAEASAGRVKQAALEANQAVQTLDNVRKVITVAAAAAGLAAAICAKDLSAVKTSCKSLFKAAKG